MRNGDIKTDAVCVAKASQDDEKFIIGIAVVVDRRSISDKEMNDIASAAIVQCAVCVLIILAILCVA